MTPLRRMDSIAKQGMQPGGKQWPYMVPVLRSLRQKDGLFKGIKCRKNLSRDRQRDRQRHRYKARQGQAEREGGPGGDEGANVS